MSSFLAVSASFCMIKTTWSIVHSSALYVLWLYFPFIHSPFPLGVTKSQCSVCLVSMINSAPDSDRSMSLLSTFAHRVVCDFLLRKVPPWSSASCYSLDWRLPRLAARLSAREGSSLAFILRTPFVLFWVLDFLFSAPLAFSSFTTSLRWSTSFSRFLTEEYVGDHFSENFAFLEVFHSALTLGW